MAAITTAISSGRRQATATPTPTRHLTVLPPYPAHVARVGPAAAYRRRRAVVVAMAVGLFLLTWAVLETLAGALGVAEAPSEVPPAPAPITVEVAPGDTFWSIATRLQPHGDPRPMVDRLVASHGGGVLRAGEHLSLRPS